MHLLRLLRSLAPRTECARRPAAAPRARRLSFERLETRDLLAGALAGTVGGIALSDFTTAAGGTPQRWDVPDHATPLHESVAEVGDRAAIVVAVDGDEWQIVVVVYVPPQVLMHALDAWMHDGTHPLLSHPVAAPAIAGDIAGNSRAAPTASDPPSIGPAQPSAITAVAPADNARIGSGASPNVFLPPAVAAPNLPLVDTWGETTHARPVTVLHTSNNAEPVAAGVPGQTSVSLVNRAGSAIDARTSFAEPPAVPWLAGFLTPLAQLDIAEPLFALEHIVGAAQSLGETIAGRLASLVTSPWLACAALAMTAVEVCRRRAQRATRATNGAPEVPEVSAPSQLV